ncbi:MAG: hypothetical protein Q8K58_02565 [Acidimicrobiales bacterium]|nr:hypothetical protein [Acidimicrobiales bacterium]
MTAVRLRRFVGAVGASLLLLGACGDDDAQDEPSGEDTEVDGGESNTGDQSGTTVDGSTTGGGTQGDQEVPGGTPDTTQSTAQDADDMDPSQGGG